MSNYNTWQYRTHSTCQEPRCCPPDSLEGTPPHAETSGATVSAPLTPAPSAVEYSACLRPYGYTASCFTPLCRRLTTDFSVSGTAMYSYPDTKPVILRECDVARFESWARGDGVLDTSAAAAASDSLAPRLALATHQGRSGQTSIPCDRSDRLTSYTAAVSDQRAAAVYSRPPRHSEIAMFSGLGNQQSGEACRCGLTVALRRLLCLHSEGGDSVSACERRDTEA